MNIKYFFVLLLLIGVVTRSTTSLSNVHPTDEATTPKTSPLPDYFTEDEATTPFPDYYEDYNSAEVEPDKTTYEPTYQPTTTTYEPTTTTYEPTTTTCEPTTTPCEPTTTKRTTTPKPTRTTTPKPTTKPPPSWKAGVYEHVEKCKAALKFYVGPTYKTAKTLLDAFLCLIPKLEHSTTSHSPIISSYAEEILETISIMSEVGTSPSGILNGFEDVLFTVCNNYANMILRLSVKIGVSTSDVANAVTELEVALSQIITDWKNAAPLHIGDDNIDYEPVLKSIQKLTNAVACVSKAALKNCENDANVRDSLYILALIFDHLVIIGHATNVSIAADLNVRCGGISDPWSQCLKVIDNLVCGLTRALNAVVKTVLEAVISIVKAIVDLAKSLNEVLKTVFGLVENLTKTVSHTLKGVTGGLLNILKVGK